MKRAPIDIELQEKYDKGTYVDMFLPRLNADDPEKLRTWLRLSPINFQKLLDLIEPYLPPINDRGRPPIPNDFKLAIVLHYLAQGTSQRDLARQWRIARSTAHKIISIVLPIIYTTLQPIYMPAPNANLP